MSSAFYEDDGEEWSPSTSNSNLPPTPPPPSSTNKEDGSLVFTSVSPSDAFQVFNGKIIPNPSSSSSSSSTGTRPSQLPTSSASASSNETSLQKYARLKVEVDDLVRSLQITSAESNSTNDQNPIVATELMSMAYKLSSLLDATRGSAIAAVHDRSSVSTITNAIRSNVERVRVEREKNPIIDDSASASDGGNGVTYELYMDKGSSSISADNVALETRLSALEHLILAPRTDATKSSNLNANPNPSTRNRSLASRLADAEAKLEKFDASKVEALAAKARIIRDDLVAAASAHSKLSKSMSTAATAATSNNAVSPEVIANLYEKFISLEQIHTQLPTIVSRLHALQDLHCDAGEFSLRLTSVEKNVKSVSAVLSSCEESLKALEEGMAGNLETVAENIEVVEERLKRLPFT